MGSDPRIWIETRDRAEATKRTFYISLCAAPGDCAALEMLTMRLDTFDGLVAWHVGRGPVPPALVVYLFSDLDSLRHAMRMRTQQRPGSFELFINIGEPLTRRLPHLLLCQTTPGALRQTLETIAAVCFHGAFARGIVPFSTPAIRALFEMEGWIETRHYTLDAFYEAAAETTSDVASKMASDVATQRLMSFDPARTPAYAFCALSHMPTKRHKPDYSNVVTAFGTLIGKCPEPQFAFSFRSGETRIDTLTVFTDAQAPADDAPTIDAPSVIAPALYTPLQELTAAQ